MLTTRSIIWLLLISITFFGSPNLAKTQSATATLTGTITDERGAVVSGATVIATNGATGTQRQVSTNESGQFFISSLQPSTYTLSVEGQGFALTEVKT